MPLIKVSPSKNLEIKKLVSASNLDEFKNGAEKKLGYSIGILRIKDGFEIDDDDVFLELLKEKKDLWIIAEETADDDDESYDDFGKKVKVYIQGKKEPACLMADSLEELKLKAEKSFRVKFEKFIRKDGFEIDDDDTFWELLNSDEDLSLIGLKEGEKYDDSISEKGIIPKKSKQKKIEEKKIPKNIETTEDDYDDHDDYDNYDDDDDDKNSKLNDFNSILKLIEGLKAAKPRQRESKPSISTKQIKKKELELKEKFREQEKRKLAKEENLKILSKKEETLLKDEEKLKKLDEEIRRKKFESLVTREESKTEIAKKEAKLLELEIKNKRIANIFHDLKQAEKVDICFMVDCTGSMSSYIVETKAAIHQMCDKLRKRFQDFDLRTAFVGYRDISDGDKRVTVFPFSKEVNDFKRFVSSIDAVGGADECEDIFGGLEELGKLEWSNMSRVLVHIGDAPCHGKRFHSGAGDSYPDGDPRGLNITNLIKKLISLNVMYYFAEINNSTLKMIEEFDKELIANQGKQISVVKLASASSLTDMVTKSVVTTIMTSKSESVHLTRHKTLKTILIDPNISWDISKMERHSAIFYKVTYNGTLSELNRRAPDYDAKNGNIWIAKNPFSKGAMRYAYVSTNQPLPLVKYVAKESLSSDPEYNIEKYYKEFMENHVISSFLARMFTEELKKKSIHKLIIRYVDASYIHIRDTGKYFTFENFLEGKFEKWISNAGVVDEDIYACVIDAFAHWTYQVTDEYLIVLDLQGVINSSYGKTEYVLTDPAIICPEGSDRFGPTNLTIKGVKKYFENHSCNHICEKLELSRHKYQKKANRPADFCF